jgi:hypothetical protein
MLFVKSYGIPAAIPLTAANVLWLVLLAAFLWVMLKQTRRSGTIDRRFLLPAVVGIAGTLVMPSVFLGVYQPGVRFGLPALLFLLLLLGPARVAQRWAFVFLALSFCVTLYNALHFQAVDEQMRALYNDLTSHVQLRGKSFCSVRFDYPPPRKPWDVAAASVDPLFGAVYYAGLDSGGGVAWIFGSALLKVRETKQRMEFRENSKEDLAQQLLDDPPDLPYDVVVLVGNDPALEQRLKLYRGRYQRGRLWTILTAR